MGANAQTKTPSSSKAGGTIIVDPIETNPRFPGGEKAFQQFLAKNLKWPKTNVDAQGKVFLTFFIQKDGRLTDAKVVRGVGSPFDEEALRVIRKSPKWSPATQNGKPVSVRYNLSIPFYLQQY